MTSTQDRSNMELNIRQQELGRFDIERQYTQRPSPSSGSTSDADPPQNFASRCIGALQNAPGLQRRIHPPQDGTQDTTSESCSTPLPLGADQPVSNRPGQLCFLCLTKKQGQTAIAIPCYRPTQERQIKYTRQKFGSPTRTVCYHEIKNDEKAVESDTAIFERLNSACFKHHGTWKRWIPFYGVIKVEEVTFQFQGVVDNYGTFPITMERLDISKIQQEINKTLSMEPDNIEAEFGDQCTGDGWHSTQCQLAMDHGWQTCVLEQISVARSRQRKIAMLDVLTTCGRDPSEANGRRLFEGMAADSSMYEAE